MTVFLTGITGLVGSEIAKQFLDKGYRVKALVRNLDSVDFHHPSLEYVPGDLGDVFSLVEYIKGADYVVHAAAMVSFAPKDRKEIYKTNVLGTANVVNACLANDIKKLCHISSIAAFGRPSYSEMKLMDKIEIDEDQKWVESETNSNYAISKHLGEIEVWRGGEEGLPIVIVNPSIVLGEGDWNKSSAELFKYVYQEKPYYPEGYINYVDVKDVAGAVVTLTESDITGERFCLSAGMISYQSFFDKIADQFGKKRPGFKVSTGLMGFIWRFEAIKSFLTGKAPLITKETARTAQLKIYQKNDKIKNTLGFEFTPLDETIKRVCENLLLINKE